MHDRDIQLTARDGTILHGTAFLPPGSQRAMILLHMAGGNRETWNQLQRLLYLRGIASVVVDFRGNRLSGTDEHRRLYKGKHYPHFQTFWKDAQAIHDYLVSKGFKPSCIGVAGGSVGSTASVIYATRVNPDSPLMVLLSPGLSYFDIDTPSFMKDFGDRKLLITWAEQAKGEPYSAHKLKNMHPRPQIVATKSFDGGFWKAHAELAFDFDPTFEKYLAEWIDNNLPCAVRRGRRDRNAV